MKKKVICSAVLLSVSVLLTGCHTKHEWIEATCTEPRTCSECGETEGEPLGHSWVEATCREPKICSTCGETEGEPLGHSWVEANYTTPKTCSICGETEGEPLPQPYADANGLEFYKGTSFTTTGVRFNADEPDDFEVIDADVDIINISVEDAEADGYKNVTIDYTVSGQIWVDIISGKGKLGLFLPQFAVFDIYTGRIVPSASTMENEQTASVLDIEWEGRNYFVEDIKNADWSWAGWIDASDGKTSTELGTMHVTETLLISNDYDGLALIMTYYDDDWDYEDIDYEIESEAEEYVLDYTGDKELGKCYFILVSDAYEILNN